MSCTVGRAHFNSEHDKPSKVSHRSVGWWWWARLGSVPKRKRLFPPWIHWACMHALGGQCFLQANWLLVEVGIGSGQPSPWHGGCGAVAGQNHLWNQQPAWAADSAWFILVYTGVPSSYRISWLQNARVVYFDSSVRGWNSSLSRHRWGQIWVFFSLENVQWV